MKKSAFLLILLVVFLSGAFAQVSPFTLHGTVTDVANSAPVPGKTLYISVDSNASAWNYFNSVVTDSSGQYSVSITPPSGSFFDFYISTTDCRNQYISYSFQNSSASILRNFSICSAPPCIADFSYFPDSANSPTAPFLYHFIDASSGNATSWFWSFGDSSTSLLQNPSHNYMAKGTYQVCLTISGTNGCSDTYCSWINIATGNPCQSWFTYSTDTLMAFFDAFNSDSASSSTYSWNFGDSSTGSGKSVNHLYTKDGAYTVTLSAITIKSMNDTCYSTYSDIVTVNNQNPSRYMLYGSVSNPLYNVDDAVVYLILHNPKDSSLTALDSTYAVDSAGIAYYFFNISNAGDYLVKAALLTGSTNYSHLIPTYHLQSLYWDSAQSITINSTNQFAVAAIQMVSGTNPEGPGFIGGKTYQGANIFIPGEKVYPGVQIILLDDQNKPVAYTFSNSNGNWEFDNIPLGTFRIYPEIAGLSTEPAIVTLTEQNKTISDIEFVVNDKSVNTSIKKVENPMENKVGEVYPSPATDHISIEIKSENSKNISISITNIAGQELLNKSFKINNEVLNLNTNHFPNGIYLLKISFEDHPPVYRQFIISK